MFSEISFRSSHTVVFFKIAVLQLRSKSLKNISHGFRVLLELNSFQKLLTTSLKKLVRINDQNMTSFHKTHEVVELYSGSRPQVY